MNPKVSPSRSQQGVALIIALAFIVLLTGLVVAFFSRSMNERQVSDASANQTKVALLAQGAIDQIIGDFKQELRAGSTNIGSGTNSIYYPNDWLPALPSAPGGAPENVLKWSGYNQAFYTLGGASGPKRAADLASTGTSQNGRSIPLARWNAPLLLPKADGASDADLTPVTSGSNGFRVPDWILVARDGTNPTAWSNNLRTSAAGSGAVVGRYAYVVYHEGALLDLNVAGYPTASSGTLSAYKPALAYADLRQIPGIGVPDPVVGSAPVLATAQGNKLVDTVVGWRNYSSAKASGAFASLGGAGYTISEGNSYWNAVVSNTTGFLRVSGSLSNNQSDRMFGSRQELIRFLTQGVAATAAERASLQNALRYLTHFSRELNAPSWGPVSPAGSSVDYGSLANTSGTNRFVPGVKVSSAFTRADGTMAAANEPLVKSRFPLSRLAGLGPDGIVTNRKTTLLGGVLSVATKETVQRDFGLVWNASENRWDYCGPSGTTLQSAIATIGSIGDREPNFFELLKAGILSGSLGVNTSEGPLTVPAIDNPSQNGTTDAVMRDTDFQVLRIGACILDQFDADHYPTRIAMRKGFADWVAPGVERLPYISRWSQVPMRSPDPATPGATGVYQVSGTGAHVNYSTCVVIVPIVACPFQGPDLHSSSDDKLLSGTASVPKIRLTIEGSVQLEPNTWGSPIYPGTAGRYLISPTVLPLKNDIRAYLGQDQYIAVGDVDGSVPLFTSGNGMAWEQFSTHSSWTAAPGRGFPVGFRLPNYYAQSRPMPPANYPPDALFPTNPQNGAMVGVKMYGKSSADRFQISLEFQDPSGAWHPYSMAAGVEGDPTTWAYQVGGGSVMDSTRIASGPERGLLPAPFSSAANLPIHVANGAKTISKADPRSVRFNTVSNDIFLTAPEAARWSRGLWNSPNTTVIRPDGSPGAGSLQLEQAFAGLGFNDDSSIPDGLNNSTGTPKPARYYPALYCRNIGANNTQIGSTGAYYASYKDADGVQRIGDGGLYPLDVPGASSSFDPPLEGNPHKPSYDPAAGSDAEGNNIDRPTVLNRPFRSVGELGYVFRDQPFKTLSFFTDNSADAALLDLFCLGEIPSGIRAGVVNVNTPYPAVLQSILAGAASREQLSPAALDPGVTSALAEQLITHIASKPTGTLKNKAELAGFVMTSGTAVLGSYNKQALEAVIRALNESVQTRTWNLMLDVIAQTGRYGPNATGLQQFIVEGERRCWVHLAIDRFTGRVIDQQIEVVTE